MIPLLELKEYLGIDPEDTSEDAALSELERNAVAFIETQTRRYFGPPENFEEIIDGRGLRKLWLSEPPVEPPVDPDYPGPLGALVKVDETNCPGAPAIAIEDFELRLTGHDAYLIRTGCCKLWLKCHEYMCRYWRGYPPGEEPGDIRQLVLDLVSVKRTLLGTEALRSETIGGYSYTRFGNTDLDAVMGGWATIESWKRLVYG